MQLPRMSISSAIWPLMFVPLVLMACRTSEAQLAKSMRLHGESVSIAGAIIEADLRFEQQYPVPLASLRSALGDATAEIRIEITTMDGANPATVPERVRGVIEKSEAYWIKITAVSVSIMGSDLRGALYGLTMLENLYRNSPESIRAGEILDWPDHARRAVHMVLRKNPAPIVRRVIDQARLARMNTLILQLADAVRLDSDVVAPKANAMEKQEFVELVAYARANGLEVVPEIKLLTHQEKFFRNRFPDLMYNNRTYDPRIDAVYDLVFEYLDEVLATIQPRVVHIGHDEVSGLTKASRRKWLGEGQEPLPPELYLQDVVRLYDFLSARGVEVWMWGDMLIAPDEFPEMLTPYMHGIKGYSNIRNRIPKQIVICDWHYFDKQSVFPSARTFAEAGFRVLGSTRHRLETIRNFSRYVADLPFGGEGMIATTWDLTQKRRWDTVDQVIQVSGEAFWNAH